MPPGLVGSGMLRPGIAACDPAHAAFVRHAYATGLVDPAVCTPVPASSRRGEPLTSTAGGLAARDAGWASARCEGATGEPWHAEARSVWMPPWRQPAHRPPEPAGTREPPRMTARPPAQVRELPGLPLPAGVGDETALRQALLERLDDLGMPQWAPDGGRPPATRPPCTPARGGSPNRSPQRSAGQPAVTCVAGPTGTGSSSKK